MGSRNKSRDGPRLLEYRPQLEAGRRTTTDGSCCLFSVGRGLRLLEYTRQHPSRQPTRPTPAWLLPFFLCLDQNLHGMIEGAITRW